MDRLSNRSGVSREVHAPFYEGLAGRFRWSTHQKIEEEKDLEEGAMDALRQIEQKNYASELYVRGVQKLLFLGIALSGKRIFVKHVFS